MRKNNYSIIPMLVFVISILGSDNAYSQTVIERESISFFTFVSCANNGNGEFVIADNVQLQIVSKLSVDANGGVHIKSHTQPHQYWDLIGEVTGDRYQATGLTGSTTNFISNGESYNDTFYNNFRIIGPGTGNNYLLHVNSHVTIDANGQVNVDAINVSITCK